MAKLTSDGIDQIVDELRQLQLLGEDTVITKMMEAGSREIVNAWKEEITANNHIDSGDMINSVGSQRLSVNVYEVYPQGKDSKGVSNAEKAFCLHYGVGHGRRAKKIKSHKYKLHTYKGTHFVDAAEAKAEEKCAEVMQEVMDDYIKKIDS